MTMNNQGEIAIRVYNEATKTTTGHDQDPELRLRADSHPEETTAIEIESETGTS